MDKDTSDIDRKMWLYSLQSFSELLQRDLSLKETIALHRAMVAKFRAELEEAAKTPTVH